MSATNSSVFFYAVNALGAGAVFYDERLSACTDRHRIMITRPALQQSDSLIDSAIAAGASGVVIEMVFGWANREHLKLARCALRSGMRVWFYWPNEQGIEAIDQERYGSHWRLWCFVKLVALIGSARENAYRFIARKTPQSARPMLKAVLNRFQRFKAAMLSSAPVAPANTGDAASNSRLVREYEQMLDRLISAAKPNAFGFGVQPPSSSERLKGTGAYLRTDYWSPINTGGSYGHTCYVAKELAATTSQFVCFMANRFGLLDEMGLEQRVMAAPSPTCDELSLILANASWYDFLAPQFARGTVTYIYERICLGNFVGARLSQELGIPYIVEYNGSEISMRRSFDVGEFEYEAFFLKAEEAAFRQATIISVISEPVRNDLLRRGIPGEKIVVNPNGVDLEAYAPMEENTRALLRRELGFAPSDRVVGFIGTFGGWHGIDVLAKALPLACERDEHVRFLLIGDGNFKHLIDDAIASHKLGDRVVCTGRVPHRRGAELLGACDIFASPHSAHMIDSRFFGSPTKLFEYMAMGGGIVGSDLEQIGEVLSPALRATQLDGAVSVTDERSVLCTPGSVSEFVDAVVFMSRHPDICAALGTNARAAAATDFSWQAHIERLWRFATERNNGDSVRSSELENAS